MPWRRLLPVGCRSSLRSSGRPGSHRRPESRPRGVSLPKADVLIVTWTVDEGHALSRVLTPGVDSHDGGRQAWKPYTKNYEAISAEMRAGCPARQYKRLGTYWTTKIGDKRVTLFKSDSHMSQDGPKLANALVWKQIIEDSRPSLVITTGTGGGIGTEVEVGDVIVSRFITFDCQRGFKKYDGDTYASAADAPHKKFKKAEAAVRLQRPVPAEGQQPAAEDHHRHRTDERCPDHRLLRLRHQRRPLPTARQKRPLRDGRRRARHGLQTDGRQSARLQHRPQRLRPADRLERPADQPAGEAGRRHLQGLRTLEHRLQRDRLLGDRRQP